MADGTFVSYLADPADPTYATPEVDLNGVETGLGVFETDAESLDVGAPALDGSWLTEAGVDDDVLASYRRGRVDSSFNLRVVMPPGASYNDLRGAVMRLNHALDRFGVWVLQPPGQADPYLIDYFPSSLVSQLRPGARSLYILFQLLTSVEGMPIVLTRRPLIRGPLLIADVNLVSNGTFADDANNDDIPTAWAWSVTTALDFAFDWGYNAYRVTASASASAGSRWLSQAITSGIVEGASYAFAFDVATLAASGKYPLGRIDWLDGGGARIGSSVYATPPVYVPGPNDGFGRIALAAVAPPGVVGVRFGVEFAAANASQPIWIRCAQFEAGEVATTFRAGPETVTNDPTQGFGKRIWLWGAGNAPSLARIRAEPDAAGVAQFTYARRSGPRDSNAAMREFPGWRARNSTALLHGSATVSDAGAAGGTAVQLGITNDLLRSVLREEFVAVEESALRGTWVLKASLRGTVGDAYYVQGRYGLGDVDDLPRPMTLRYIDLTAPPVASNYYVVNLGLFDVPFDSSGFYFELWATRDGSTDGPHTGSLYAAELWIEPADDGMTGSASVPGTFDPGGSFTEQYNGSRMVTPPDGLPNDPYDSHVYGAGSVYAPKDAMLLNAPSEGASIPANMTSALTAGVEHQFTLDMVLFTPGNPTSQKHGEVRVWDFTATTMVQAFGVYNRNGEAWSAQTKTLKFTPVAGHAYLVYVIGSAVGSLRVDDWKHAFNTPPAPGDIETVTIQADQRRAFVSIGDTFDRDLELVPPYPVLAPGLQLFRIASADVAPAGSEQAIDGEPGVRHVPTRTLYVAVDQVPRWSS